MPEVPKSLYEVQRDARIERNRLALERVTGLGARGAEEALKRVRDEELEEAWGDMMSD